MSAKIERQFKPEKLFEPRNFERPFIQDKQYLEIGAGKGMHAMQFAEKNPDKHLIAIERTRAKFEVFAERAEEVSLNNLQPIHADAIPWVVHALPPASLDGVYLLYPNPEPKNSSQRWLNMPFFEFLISRVKPGAALVLVTNIEEYFKEAVEVNHDVWKLTAEESDVPKNSARTHFEIKYLARGENCFQLQLTKPHNYETAFDEWKI